LAINSKMKTTIKVLAFLFTIVLATQCTIHKARTNYGYKQLSDSTLSKLYTKGLKNSYPYMFSESSPTLTVNGTRFGQFVGGLKGLLFYTNFKYALYDKLKEDGLVNQTHRERFKYDSHAEVTTFRLFSGYSAFASGDSVFTEYKTTNGKQDFHHYNENIINWGINNLIPSPNTPIGDKTAQELYDAVFARFFRTMTASYVYINKQNYDAEVAAYQSNFSDPKFEAKEYLQMKYGNKIPEFESREIYSVMKPSMAVGFWLRRKIDGTNNAMWRGLQKVMVTYDKLWFQKHGVVTVME
jgi:hypothetical protein